MLYRRWLVFLITMVIVTGCTLQPEKIHYGEDQCAYCKMNIADPKFGGELVTSKGRVYKFDAVECMVHFQQENEQGFRYMLVTPYDLPGELVDKDSVAFVIADTIKSPMGANLAALDKRNYLRDDQVLSWDELKREIGH